MMNVETFKEQCLKITPDIIVQKHLIDGNAFFFQNIVKDGEFEFKKNIANILDVHIRDIVIVGSGKLGFSIKPDKDNPSLYLFKKFDYDYEKNNASKKSDLDIGIISSNLFDKELLNLYDHTDLYKTFIGKDRTSFGNYVLKGRFILRFLPDDFKLTKEILNVQEKYKEEFGREVNIEIYKSWYFFERYHVDNVRNLQINLIA